MKLSADYPAAALLAAYLFYDQTGTALWVLLGAAIHEAGHLAAIRLTGERLREIRLRPFSVRIDKTRSNAAKELLISAAGPLAGLLAAGALFAAGCVRGAAASLVLTVFNLLPVYPLDGWRLLDVALETRCLPQTARKIKTAAGVSALAAVVLWMVFQAVGRG